MVGQARVWLYCRNDDNALCCEIQIHRDCNAERDYLMPVVCTSLILAEITRYINLLIRYINAVIPKILIDCVPLNTLNWRQWDSVNNTLLMAIVNTE